MVNAIEVKDLGRRYRKSGFALENITFTLPSGCVMGLVGRNGAGKTTLIKILLDILSPDSGEFTLLEEKDIVKAKEDVGAVFDEILFGEGIRAGKLGSWARNAWKNWDESLFQELLGKYEIPENVTVNKLSKGQKMKLQIALALAHHPKLLVLDEATAGLDPLVRDEVLDMINEFTRDEEHSVLISSHITGDLEKVCDYIAFLKDGKLEFVKEKDEILSEYGILQCTKEVFEGLMPEAILSKRESAYGVEAVVRRDMVPSSMELIPCSLEEIFVSMMKE